MKLKKNELNFMFKPKKKILTRRSFAYILDILIVDMFIVFPFKSFLEDYNYIINFNFDFKFIVLVLVVALLTLSYFAVFEYYFNQTIGKLILGIKTISRKGRLTFTQALNRNVSKISTLLLILDCLYLLKKTNQRYSDKLAHTMVVDKDEF
ncbi:MAG: RDD family protein [Candidatus Nanoarchaeia archaeon]|nr:RDD family protein [Candidatus Nanoarchaeia archaeon]